jgi:histidine kinase
LVNDLAEVSKVETGAVTLHLERFDLVVLVREIVERYEPMFLEQGNAIQVNLLEQAFVNADRDRVTQILINLLTNTLKHAPGSRVDLNIQARANQTFLEVCDAGPGIPAEHLPHLFERFYRVDPSRSSDTGGSGVGLTVSRHLAIAMGGRLEVESGFGTGSSFTLILPST